jgi:2-C-methyl-D-erythritol 2,4-cyclodiphosphate synthase
MNCRIGFGYDVHRLESGYDLIIGGVKIPFKKGATGHSDADVLIHAICDALLGAAALGDIGQHFPDNSAEYKNIDSAILLKRVVNLLTKEKFRLGNIDTTICLQSPKLASFIPLMRENLAKLLSINIANVSVKATTTEKLGFVGEGQGISAYAVAMIEKM